MTNLHQSTALAAALALADEARDWQEALGIGARPSLDAALDAVAALVTHPLPRLRSEFPDYPVADLPAIPAHWSDDSWHNDAAPFFTIAPMVGMFIDWPVAADRETVEQSRFTVVPLDDGQHVADARTLYHGDDWNEALSTAIAAAFVANLRDELTAEQFEAMRQKNVGIAEGICASHDFCDANMPMADAFETVTGYAPMTVANPDPDGDRLHCSDVGTPESDAAEQADCALWNRAWNIAMPFLTADDSGTFILDVQACLAGRHTDTGRGVCADCGEFLNDKGEALPDVPPATTAEAIGAAFSMADQFAAMTFDEGTPAAKRAAAEMRATMIQARAELAALRSR